jgi:hypothetical protein
MLCVGLVAALVPARRALAVDPMILQREEWVEAKQLTVDK